MNKLWPKILVIIAAVICGLFLRDYFFKEESKEALKSDTVTECQVNCENSQVDSVFTQETLEGRTMGTTYHITYFPTEVANSDSATLKAEVDAFLVDFNKEFSTYDPTSVISTFNKTKDVSTFQISERFATVVKESFRIFEVTNGYLDVTVYPLVKAWGFGPGKAKDSLTEEDVQELKQHIGLNKLSLKEEGGQYYLEKKDPELMLDFSAIAKGFGVDLVADILKSKGAKNFIVEIGGEVSVSGVNQKTNKPWTLAIEQPKFDGSSKIQVVINPDNQAVATSGSYRNFRFANGKRISHEIDPVSGFPIQHSTVSLTVVDSNCMAADGLATGLFVMGKDKALEIANKLGLSIYVIYLEDGVYKAQASNKFNSQFGSSIKQ